MNMLVLQFLRCSGPNNPHLPFQILAGSCGKFAPFEIKENMVLAPLCRIALYPDFLEQLDRLLHTQNSEVSFLRDLKCRKPRKTGPTFVNSSTTVNRLVCVLGLFSSCFCDEQGTGFKEAVIECCG